MGEKEVMILKLIKENPFITQNELAQKTGLSRSAVAGYISTLTKRGKLLGRAYVFPKKKQIVCIGGANLDRKIQVVERLQLHTSNPAYSSQSFGGVARNIAENLGRLTDEVSLMTVVGEDQEGKSLLNYTKDFVDVSAVSIIPNKTTGSYTAILDEKGEMAVALADMDIYDSIDKPFIEKKWGYVASAQMVILDTNFPSEVIIEVINRCKEEDITLCITPVSAPKIKKLPQNLTGVTWLIANKDEACALTGLKLEKETDFFKAAKKIVEKGVEKVVITRGSEGLIFFTNTGEKGVIPVPKVEVVDVTGAGDSLVAGIMFGSLNGLSTSVACKLGIACSILTLQSKETVNVSLTEENLNELYQKYFPKGDNKYV